MIDLISMTPFRKEIAERLELLKMKNKLHSTKKRQSKIYLGSADEENGVKIVELSEFQIAFIDLFEEKNIQLGMQFHEILKADVKSAVDPDVFDKINLDEDVGFYNLVVPAEKGSDEWSVELATSFDETIFHVYFTGWTFQSIGVTH